MAKPKPKGRPRTVTVPVPTLQPSAPTRVVQALTDDKFEKAARTGTMPPGFRDVSPRKAPAKPPARPATRKARAKN